MHAPIRAELEPHDDAGDDTEPECHAEDLEPELEDQPIHRPAGPQMHGLEHSEPRCQSDREGRKDDVECDGRSELYPGKQKCREVHWKSPLAPQIGPGEIKQPLLVTQAWQRRRRCNGSAFDACNVMTRAPVTRLLLRNCVH